MVVAPPCKSCTYLCPYKHVDAATAVVNTLQPLFFLDILSERRRMVRCVLTIGGRRRIPRARGRRGGIGDGAAPRGLISIQLSIRLMIVSALKRDSSILYSSTWNWLREHQEVRILINRLFKRTGMFRWMISRITFPWSLCQSEIELSKENGGVHDFHYLKNMVE